MDEFRSQYRISRELADRLKQAAKENERSLNAELSIRLQNSFEPSPPLSDADVRKIADELAKHLVKPLGV